MLPLPSRAQKDSWTVPRSINAFELAFLVAASDQNFIHTYCTDLAGRGEVLTEAFATLGTYLGGLTT